MAKGEQLEQYSIPVPEGKERFNVGIEVETEEGPELKPFMVHAISLNEAIRRAEERVREQGFKPTGLAQEVELPENVELLE